MIVDLCFSHLAHLYQTFHYYITAYSVLTITDWIFKREERNHWTCCLFLMHKHLPLYLQQCAFQLGKWGRVGGQIDQNECKWGFISMEVSFFPQRSCVVQKPWVVLVLCLCLWLNPICPDCVQDPFESLLNWLSPGKLWMHLLTVCGLQQAQFLLCSFTVQ